MAVRQQVVGIDGPETLERALRSAFYLADDGLSTAAYLALALGKPTAAAARMAVARAVKNLVKAMDEN